MPNASIPETSRVRRLWSAYQIPRRRDEVIQLKRLPQGDLTTLASPRTKDRECRLPGLRQSDECDIRELGQQFTQGTGLSLVHARKGNDEVHAFLAHHSNRTVGVADMHDIIALVDEHIADDAPKLGFVRDHNDDRRDGHVSSPLPWIYVGEYGRFTRMRKREHLIRLGVGAFHPRGAGWHAGDRDPCYGGTLG